MTELESILEEVPALAGAKPVHRLAGGQASDSWRLESQGGPLMLRIDRPLAARLGLDRGSEFEVLTAAHAAGLGPEPLYRDPGRGILLTRFLPGGHWQPELLEQAGKLEQLGRLLRRVHDLPRVGREFEPVRIAERYARQYGVMNAKYKVDAVADLAEQLYPAGEATGVCHGDPNAANIIGTDAPRLIDWEYSVLGDPLFDLAVVVRYHQLDSSRTNILIEAWSGSKSSDCLERLQAVMRLYDLLADLWQQVVSNYSSARD